MIMEFCSARSNVSRGCEVFFPANVVEQPNAKEKQNMKALFTLYQVGRHSDRYRVVGWGRNNNYCDFFFLLFTGLSLVPESRYLAVPEKIHTHSMEGHRKFLGRGGGVLKVKILENKVWS